MIRPWRLSDTKRIVELSRLGAAEAYPGRKFSEERIKKMALEFYNDQTGDRVCFVWEDDNELLGCIAGVAQPYFFSDDKMMLETGLFVDPKVRGGQVALGLLNALESASRSIGVHEMVSCGPKRAAAFYSKAGYTVDGVVARKVLQ